MASSCRTKLLMGFLSTSLKMPSCTRILVLSLLVFCLIHSIFAKPLFPHTPRDLELTRVRRSGISDQRLAELEAIIAMSKAGRLQHAGHHGKIHSTASYGYGMFNPEEMIDRTEWLERGSGRKALCLPNIRLHGYKNKGRTSGRSSRIWKLDASHF